MALNKISGGIIGAAIQVHKELGPGLLESAYQECLERELIERGHRVERQRSFPVVYKGAPIKRRFRLDMVIDGLLPAHEAQILSYLRLARLSLGLLINFHETTLLAGLRRFRISVSSSPSVPSPNPRKEPTQCPRSKKN